MPYPIGQIRGALDIETPASALQIGQIVIATPLVVVITRWIGSEYDTSTERPGPSPGLEFLRVTL